jgi:hypothetical protein
MISRKSNLPLVQQYKSLKAHRTTIHREPEHLNRDQVELNRQLCWQMSHELEPAHASTSDGRSSNVRTTNRVVAKLIFREVSSRRVIARQLVTTIHKLILLVR